MPDVRRQLGIRFGDEPRIDASHHPVGCTGRKIERIVEVVRRTRHIELGVLNIPSYLPADFQVVRTMVDRHHVSVVVNMLLKELGVAVIRPEPHRGVAIADIDGRHTGD